MRGVSSLIIPLNLRADLQTRTKSFNRLQLSLLQEAEAECNISIHWCSQWALKAKGAWPLDLI